MIINNKKGFGKFEVLTILVFAFGFIAYSMTHLLRGASKQEFDTMKDSAVSFAKVVSTNSSSFSNFEVVYLNEVIEEQFLNKIKNPFDKGYCDETESKVEFIDGKTLVTLKCGDHLIEKAGINSQDNMKVYLVGKWSEEKPNNPSQKKVLYNCVKDDKELFAEYKEDMQVVSRLNKENGTEFYFLNDVSDFCKPVSKTFYRSKKILALQVLVG